MAQKGSGTPAPSDTAEGEPLTIKEAHTLLATARPAAVLNLLKNPDFAMIAGVSFMGFRVEPKAYANPLVRRRMAEEAVRDHRFAGELRKLASAARSAPTPTPATPPKSSPAASQAPVPHPEQEQTAKYRAERDRLRQERDEAVEAKRVAERGYGQARADQLAAETARAKAEQEAERLQARLAREERRARRLENENAALMRAAAGVMQSEERNPEPASVQVPNQPREGQSAASERRFAAAVRHLLDKEKWALAAQIASDVLRSAPDDTEALAIRARALEGQGRTQEAITDLRRLTAAQIARADDAGASEALLKLLSLTARPASESRLIRDLYAMLASTSRDTEQVRDIFGRLRATAPANYALLHDLAQGEIAERLFGPSRPGALSADDPLPLAAGPLHGLTLSARRLAGAIDRNDAELVSVALAAARDLREESRAQIEEAFADAGADPSYAGLIFRGKLAGPVVVDASNIAWHGQEMIVGGRPRIGQMMAIRRALRERGYFPIYLIADANLPYVADEPTRVRQMARDGELVLAPGGSDADEHILREARRLSAPVVSNDYMADWDPDQSVGKVQYDISPVDGHATLYF